MEKYEDPIVKEVRERRKQLWADAHRDVSEFLRGTVDFVKRLGFAYCDLKPTSPKF